ncbi:LamG domain-containing protein [Kribbella sp. CA-293567]|uniref:LamG domain-containing protein n=1 Tax=Kribbella sp. CA-293567 TaxID=3002436 RepID=UPI0022DD6BFB|nr:LamG domain-containing protein [Kribbella sp. CA-293567]WBQ02017.1 LamG domain-containing protein [Kribbella sp. CA-293567]
MRWWYTRSRRARIVTGSLVLTLAAVTLPTGAATAAGTGQQAAALPTVQPPKPPVVKTAPNEAQASAAAERQGTPVEVTGLRSETGTVFALPNGEMNLEISAVPVRAKKGNAWTAVDTGLVRRTDGALVPKSATVELAFSGGGSKLPMVTFGKEGKRLALTWPGVLPTPKLTGDTATYAEVLPGTDLVLKAGASGYTQHLVVKSAAAAKNPALDRIRLGLTSTGLKIRATTGGGLEARDAKGAVAFTAPPSAMWDAGTGKAVAGVKVDATSLTLIPDAALLRGPKTVYPVTIDPDWRTYGKTYWTSVVSGNGGTPYPNTSPGGSDVAQVGKCDFTGCNGIGVARSYFQFDTGAWGFLQGKRIMGGWLDSGVVHSANCTAKKQRLYASSDVGGGTTWNNKPEGTHISSIDAPGSNTGCTGWKESDFWVPAGHIDLGGLSTFYIQADSETDSTYWRKFDPHSTALRIRYNTAPSTPADPATDPALPAPCKWCEGKTYFSGNTIGLKATLSDPDNNVVQPQWDIYTNGAVEHRYGGFQSSGARHDTSVTLTDGAELDWYVRAWDTDEDNGHRLDYSPWTRGPGPFVVDKTPPSSMPKVTGSLYREDNQWHGGVGVPGLFTVERTEKPLPDDGTKDVDHYVWGTRFPPSTRAEASSLGGSASFEFIPEEDGPQDVFVQSVDRAGNRSPVRTLHVYVRAGNGALSAYPLNGSTTDEAYLGDKDGTLQGAPTYGPGAIGNSLHLNGVNDYFTAPSAARTDNSFSVSAWVKPESTSDTRGMAIASQQGTRASGFYLNYRGDTKKTTFMLAASDADNATTAAAQGPALQRGVWTQVTGVYDKPANRLRLYHNGVKVGDSPLPANFTPWHAAGPLTVGREKWNGVVGSPWLGAIDEVQVFDRVLSDAEVRASVGRDNVRTAHWKFDDAGGTTARNDVDGGADLVLTGNASLTGTSGGAVGGALKLPNGDARDFASGGPVVRTGQSFTTSAWVNLAEAPSDGNTRTALSAEGSVTSAFFLGYRAVGGGGKWELHLTSADTKLPRAADAVVRSDVAASLNTWTHVAAVYDAPAQQIRLYVNGKSAGTATHNGGFDATGPLTVGRGKWEGIQTNPWKGLVDDVRAYSRELSGAEIEGIVARSNVTAATWKLDGNPADSSGRTPPLDGTLNGAPAWTGGQTNVPADSDLGLKLIGNGAHLSAPSPLPDLRNSFSVAAWAKLDTNTGRASVVSQDSGGLSVFNLHASFDNRWVVVMRNCDAAMNCGETRAAGPAPQPGVWTHLAAVYDASAGRLSLYVNGVLAGSQDYRHSGIQSDPAMRVGRATWSNGAGVDPFTGAIDDVSVYNRMLFADEIATMAGRDLTLAHNWRLDEPSGPTASDAVGARTGTLAGPARIPGRLGNALNFNGTSDTVSTAAVDVDTADSFTVSSWVKLRELCEPGPDQVCHTTAVSLDGGTTSKFRLGHVRDTDNNQFGAWTFEMPEANGTVTKASVSAMDSDVDQWVHLVGVYDAPAHRLWLYVNATRQGDGTLQTAWTASGGLQLGRGRVANAAAEYWPGAIDDVRVYTGALDKSRIESLVASYPKSGGGTPVLPTDPAAHWKFDENQGTTGADASGNGRTATMKGGSGWISGRQGTGAWFDGTSGYAETAAPVVDTSASFSAGAWAYLTRTDQGSRTVLAQDGNRASGFFLQFNGASGKWAAVVPSADKDNPENNLVLTSAQKAAVGQWVHLGVVYDTRVEPRQLRLYVNGVLSAAQTGVKIPAANGPTTIGRSKWNGGATDFFPRGVDDVRIFTRALSDGEMRKVHDDVGYPGMGFWRFDDDTPRDWTWRDNASTVTGAVSYPASPIAGKALQLDGSSAITSQWWAAQPQDSFTVSGWAKLDRTDKVATIAAQDGNQLSTFVLQYRPALGKWVFGAPALDEDGAKSRYAVANQPAVAGRWTHVAGVHDYAARQLRLYVNGALAGTLNDVVLADKSGSFSIGRAQVNGAAGDFFTGQLDEVRTDLGMVPDAELARRAGYPRPAEGQLGRFVNDATGERYTAVTSATVRAGYRYERSLGAPVPSGENTTALVEGGLVYSVRPTNLPVQPIYRCKQGANTFDSLDAACEGGTQLELAGYSLAYARLARYYNPIAVDHTTTPDSAFAGYRYEGANGWLTKATGTPGTQPLISCRDGVDNFLSNQADCEGKTVIGALGNVWTQAPEGLTSTPIVRCNLNGQRFTSLSPTCEGFAVERTLGYTLTSLPAVPAIFA